MDVILFEEDFNKVSCIIDTTTRNSSFIRMAVLLKRMGIQNSNFMLTLTQPELQGVDPFSDNLTIEQKMRIGMECKINPWYAFRECIRIPSPGGEAVPYQLNRANLATMWCFFNNIDTFLTMPRQIGKTICSLALTMYSIYFLGDNVNIGLFAKGSKLQIENVRRIKEIRNELPAYLWVPGRNANTDNQESIEYKPARTKYITFVASSSKKQAESQGRGETLIWTHWDEFAYYENNDLSYQSATAASDTAGDLGRKAGLPCAHIITTTAGYTSTGAGRYAFGMKNKALRFEERYYDCKNQEELLDILGSGSSNGFMYLEFSHLQLGKDEAWFKRVTMNKDRETIDRDYLNRWIHSSGESILPKELIDKLEANIDEPVSVTIDNSLVMRWYADQRTLENPDIKNIPYVIACDSSGMVGEDFTTLVMLNPMDMAVVMTCRCNQSNLVFFAEAVVNLLKRFPRSVFVPERNYADTLIGIILHRMQKENFDDPFRRIFNRFVQDKGDQSGSIKHDVSLGSVRKQFGFQTNSETRNLLYSKVLLTTVERNYNRIYEKVIVEEICGLVIRNGRVDHKVSGNDDTLMAYLIGCWFIMYAKNISMYGIDTREILSTDDDGNMKEDHTVSELRDRVDYLEQKLRQPGISIMMRNAFEAELADLKPTLERMGAKVDSTKHISVHQVDKVKTPTRVFNMGVVQQGMRNFVM